MSEPRPVVLSGSISFDRIMSFPGKFKDLMRSQDLDVLSLSVLVEKIQNSRGGCGANIAYNLALLGDSSVLFSALGKDGKSYLRSLARLGVDISKIYPSQKPSSSFTVITDGAGNQIAGFYPGSMSDSHHLSLKEWQGTNTIVVVSAHDPRAMKKHVRESRELGLELFYDVSQQVSNIPTADLLEGINAAHIAAVNEFELEVLCQRTKLSYDDLCQKIPILLTTQGAKGSRLAGHELTKPINIHAAVPKAVIDPTGAGDAYRSGFLYGYRRGWSLKVCGQLGSTLASFPIEKQGTQEHRFTLKQVESRYLASYGETLP